MQLLYKEDWEETKERYLAWWAQDAFGRCALAVTAPKDDPPAIDEPQRPPTPEERWTDLDYLSALCEYRLSRTFFGGEALPIWSGGYPGNKRMAVFLGGEVTLFWDTGWIEPLLTGEDLSDVFSLRLEENEPHFQFALELLRRGVSEAKGKSLVTVGAFGAVGDTLAALRGTERLLVDLIERPDQVARAELFLVDLWCEAYNRFYDVVCEADEGSTCWFRLWSPGKFYAAQNDFAYMISPRMFADIFIPAFESQTRFLDHSVFHVDGVGNFNHVDAVCDLPQLQAVQILPGAGKPSPLHYMDVLERVQARGKNLHITIPANQVQTALEHLSARGLFVQTCCDSEQEARDLLKKAETWSEDRKLGRTASG